MVPMLQAKGFDVTGLDSDLFEGCIFGDESVTGGMPNIPYLRKDVRDVELSDLYRIDMFLSAYFLREIVNVVMSLV